MGELDGLLQAVSSQSLMQWRTTALGEVGRSAARPLGRSAARPLGQPASTDVFVTQRAAGYGPKQVVSAAKPKSAKQGGCSLTLLLFRPICHQSVGADANLTS